MNKALLIIENMALAKRDLALIRRKKDKEGFDVLAFSDSARFFLESQNISCVDYHDLETKGMYDGLYATAQEWGRGWYRPWGNELSLRDGYSLGCFLEWPMIYFFARFLMLYLLIDRMMNVLCPDRIAIILDRGLVLGEDLSGTQDVGSDLLAHMLKVYIAERGSLVELEIVNGSQQTRTTKERHSAIKLFCEMLNRPVRVLWQIFDRLSRKNKTIMFFEGARHFYDIVRSESLSNIGKVHLQKQIGPSLMAWAYLSGVRIVTLKGLRAKKTGRKDRLDAYMLKEGLKGFFCLNGRDLLEYLFPRLVFLLEEVLPNKVYSDLRSAVTAVRKVGPDIVVVENDSTYFEKMLVVAAKKEGIVTAVVQNGATLHKDDAKDPGLVKHDFLPFISDVFFAYGEWSRDWMLENGVDGKKIVVTGGARFDGHCRKAKNSEEIKKPRKKVVFILSDIWSKDGGVTNHIGLNTFYDHIKGFLRIAASNPDVDFVIRPHSEEHCWGEIFREDILDLKNVSVSRAGGLDEIFSGADLVAGYISTALFEALM
ncbi:MAG: hypothetical protein PHW14_01250, partial [Candidatus Omnitrophica bacterium]|nr:hypothetical protein [Candidatus Omnitrophota bacterium]